MKVREILKKLAKTAGKRCGNAAVIVNSDIQRNQVR
jgi:hypothetical protein